MCGSGCPQFGFPRLRCVAGRASGFTMMASGRLQRSKPVAWLNLPSIRFHARTCHNPQPCRFTVDSHGHHVRAMSEGTRRPCVARPLTK